MASATAVFRAHILSTTAGESSLVSSAPIAPEGNRAVLAVTIINATNAVSTATWKLQGSYDGKLWKDVTGGSIASFASFGSKVSGGVTIDYAFVRVFAEITGTSQVVLFDATIAWSQQ